MDHVLGLRVSTFDYCVQARAVRGHSVHFLAAYDISTWTPLTLGGGGEYFNDQPKQVLSAFLTPFFKAKVTPVDLAVGTISPVDPEYCGTCLPWDLHPQKHILSGVYKGQGTAQIIQASSMRGPHVCRCMGGLYLPPGLAGLSLPLTPILAVVCSSCWVLIYFQGLVPPPPLTWTSQCHFGVIHAVLFSE